MYVRGTAINRIRQELFGDTATLGNMTEAYSAAVQQLYALIRPMHRDENVLRYKGFELRFSKKYLASSVDIFLYGEWVYEYPFRDKHDWDIAYEAFLTMCEEVMYDIALDGFSLDRKGMFEVWIVSVNAMQHLGEKVRGFQNVDAAIGRLKMTAATFHDLAQFRSKVSNSLGTLDLSRKRFRPIYIAPESLPQSKVPRPSVTIEVVFMIVMVVLASFEFTPQKFVAFLGITILLGYCSARIRSFLSE